MWPEEDYQSTLFSSAVFFNLVRNITHKHSRCIYHEAENDHIIRFFCKEKPCYGEYHLS